MTSTFAELFGAAPAGVWAAPGRVNLIGEHTDYNGGLALPVALGQMTRCVARQRDDALVRVASLQQPSVRGRAEIVEVALHALRDNTVDGWSRYPLGVCHALGIGGGVDLLLDSEVPVGAGLSSSAALTCAVAIALRDLFGLGHSDADLVEVTRAAENDYVGAPTGTLDQSAALLCRPGHALLLDFGAGTHEHIPFPLAAHGLELLVVDTDTPHQLSHGGYGVRRAECAAAAAALGVSSLRAISDVAQLHSLDDPLRRRARHVVAENVRVDTVAQLLAAGSDPRLVGPVLTAGHESLRDDFEVSTPQLDRAVEVALAAGAYGARLVGGGFGGSIVALVDREAHAPIADAITAAFAGAHWRPPRIFGAAAGAGARRLV